MALTIKATDANGNPGTVHGRVNDRSGLGGHPIHGRPNLWYSSFLIDLELTAYVTAGVPLTPEITGMNEVWDLVVMGGYDPYSVNAAAPPNGITFTLADPGKVAPKLKMDLIGAEVSNGATQSSGVDVWITLGGIR